MDFKPFNAYIVDACRTAGGKKNGKLSGYHPGEFGAAVCDALIERQKINGAEVEDVVFGCLGQVGAQVPGTSVDRQAGSSQQAGHGFPMTEIMTEKYKDKMKAFEQFGISSNAFSQFGGAELLAKKYNLSREDVDRFAAISQQRAVESTKAGKFKDEIVPLPVKRKEGPSEGIHSEDEGIRPNVTLESLGKLKAFFPNGVLTPGSSSQICDGASAMLICNERGLQKLGLKPMARIHSLALAATDPVVMLEGPVPATRTALDKVKMKIEDIDLYEVNEAFGSVPLAWQKALGADIEKMNVNGGAMALGHPLGGTGVKLMATLVHELKRQKKRYGLLAICEGGGTANATIVEMMPSAKL